jgi:hypothetical protein
MSKQIAEILKDAQDELGYFKAGVPPAASTDTTLREIDEALAALSQGADERTAVAPFDERSADRIATEVARLIERQIIDSRSPAADALLDYKGGKFYGAQPAAPAPEQDEVKRCGTCPHDEPCNKCPVYLREYKPEPAQAAPSEEELEESAEIAARQLTANMQMEINEAMARGPGASDSEIREIMHGNIKRFILANVAALRSRLAGQGDRL